MSEMALHVSESLRTQKQLIWTNVLKNEDQIWSWLLSFAEQRVTWFLVWLFKHLSIMGRKKKTLIWMAYKGDLPLLELKYPFFFFLSFFINENFLTLKVFYPTGGKMVLDFIILADKENSLTELKVRELFRCKWHRLDYTCYMQME